MLLVMACDMLVNIATQMEIQQAATERQEGGKSFNEKSF
jgi:hypothetical protein